MVEVQEAGTDAFARSLGAAGVHVFWTAAPEVGLRLSREFYYDVVMVDARVDDCQDLALALARDGHRAIILAAAEPERLRIPSPLDGALRRPVACDRLARLAGDLARTGDLDAFRGALDFRG